MILSISQYIEALENNDGRLRTLQRLRTLIDDTGGPLFEMPGHGLVDFEVVADSRRHTLRCPLRFDAEAASRLRVLYERDRGLGGRFFTEWSLLDREIVLFDDEGNPFEVDILARPTPQGKPLTDFLEIATASGDTERIAAVAKSFEELVEWAECAGRSGITARRVLVKDDGSVCLTAFSANDRRHEITEMLHEAVSGRRLPETTPASTFVETERSDYDMSGEDEIRCVRDGGGWRYVDRLNRPVIQTVWMYAEPFREGRAQIETHTGKGLIDRNGRAVLAPVYEELAWDEYWGLVSVMVEGRWSLVDRDGLLLTAEPYDWIGECSEGMVLAQKEGRCGFLDIEGRLAIPCSYEDASSFSEGVALVTSGGQSFFIDATGQKI